MPATLTTSTVSGPDGRRHLRKLRTTHPQKPRCAGTSEAHGGCGAIARAFARQEPASVAAERAASSRSRSTEGRRRRRTRMWSCRRQTPRGVARYVAAHGSIRARGVRTAISAIWADDGPMPAAYGQSTITSEPNTNSTNKSRTTASLPTYRTLGAIDIRLCISIVCLAASLRVQRGACEARAAGVSSTPLHAGGGRHHPLARAHGLRPHATQRRERGVLSC